MDHLTRYRPIIDDFAAFRSACRRPLNRTIRINPLKTTRDAVQSLFATVGIETAPVAWHERLLTIETETPGGTLPWYLGWIYGQEEVSALPVTLLDPAPDETVLDVAAAPGSKTTQIAEAMDDTGRVIANDSNLGRIAPLRSNTERLGLTNVAVTHSDARALSLAAFDIDGVDRTLVDVPCSGEGTIRKNPDALADWSVERITGIAGVQKGILKRAITLTKPGGRIVYSTCTFAPEENEGVLDHVLRKTNVRICEQTLPIDSTPGITSWQGTTYDDRVARADRIYPHHNDTGGFFCATLEVPT